ncbi:MAG: hypothetical protein V1709_01670 [Planctomycetota bacterium]
MKNRTYYIVTLLSLVAFVTVFNYVGCGGGGGGGSSGSSGVTFSIVTNPASSVGQTTATLNGAGNPKGVNTNVYFQYGTTTSYGNVAGYQSIGSGTTTVNASTILTGLLPNITYNFRIVASRGGSTFYGSNVSFTTLVGTPPTCTTNDAANITYNSATLNGTVNPNGLNVTSCYFDYGTSVSYGSLQNVVTLPGNGTNPISVTANVSSLSASTLYNFRVAATNAGGITNGLNQTFNTAALPPPPTCTTNVAGNIGAISATLNGTVNPNGANVTSCYFDYGTSVSYGSQQNVATLPGSGTNPISVTANVSSLTPVTLYNFRVVATNDGGTTNGLNQTFNTEALPPPTCTTNDATNVASTSATLNGTVNPNGVNVTSCYFDYGISVSYGISATVVSLPGSGAIPVSVTANVSSLSVSTLYNFRVVATSGGGTTNGLNQTFNTEALPPPTCTTNAATNIASTSATLNGTVNPNGVNVTSCYFDYGTSVSYGISATVISLPGSGAIPVSVTANVSSLTISTTYNFRVVATNDGGTTNGNNQTFTTTGTTAVDDYCWVANSGTNNVTRISKSDSTTTTIALEETNPNPRAVAVDETYVWVANVDGASVTRISKSDLSTITIAVGQGPNGVAVDETYCWAANFSGTWGLTRIRKSDSTTTTIAGAFYQVAVDGTYCWAVNDGNTVTRIRKSDFTTTNITVGTTPRGIAVDETYCWVANASTNNVTRILKTDLSTTSVAVGATGYGPYTLTVDETYCWAANWSNPNVTRILKTDLSTTSIAVGNNPYGISVDGTYCWVANFNDGAVTRILKSDLSVTSIGVGSQPFSAGDMTGFAYDNYSRVP